MKKTALITAVLIVLVAACGATPTPRPTRTPRPTMIVPQAAVIFTFSRDIKPLLQQHCTRCHSGANPPTGLSLESYDALMKGNTIGPVIDTAGGPGRSLLYQVLASGAMPQGGPRFSDADLQKVATWIFDGAKND